MVFTSWWFCHGKKFAPNYANIFMAKWESEALDKYPKKPQCYFGYLDDIFLLAPLQGGGY